MTVKELKNSLEGLPDNMLVMLMQTNDESAYNLINTVEIREITFSDPDFDDEDSEHYIKLEDRPTETVLAITDEF
jgi:hypothetical protein